MSKYDYFLAASSFTFNQLDLWLQLVHDKTDHSVDYFSSVTNRQGIKKNVGEESKCKVTTKSPADIQRRNISF
ncbi:hypothetical protein ATANTOWER_018726 [Ataeniobius toweri]|uniref:Uncharacterized protein n=1 Tax=Ataeniobius toweri TaxID=208326 RepID=A0ABU7B8A2_9TELE|nr:hypothetical protein [Ataeniobius toweri]